MLLKTRKSKFFALLIKIFILIFIISSCTISFQNISTHGTATDLVDETQSAQADVKPVISIPAPAF